jgi:hypothetical protein
MYNNVKKSVLNRYYIVGLQKFCRKEAKDMRRWKAKSVFALVGLMLLGSSLTVCAEEVEPAGYHVYETQEDEVSDTWYGTSRGDYFQAAVTKLTHGNTGYAVCSGTTFAHRDCEELYVRIYLDQSDNGTSSWSTINYWTGRAYNDSVARVSSGSYKITRNKYYSVKGAHSVFEDDKVESTATCTDALYFD